MVAKGGFFPVQSFFCSCWLKIRVRDSTWAAAVFKSAMTFTSPMYRVGHTAGICMYELYYYCELQQCIHTFSTSYIVINTFCEELMFHCIQQFT